MAKNIKRTVLSEKSPRNRHIAWAEPKGDSLQLNIFNNGKWRPIAGGGSSTTVANKYTSDPNAPMLSMDNIFTQMAIIAEKLDINIARANPEQREQIFNELKSVKFATPKQGNAVLVDYDLDNNSLTFQCDDGSIITFTSDHGDTFITGLRPDIDGYLIWKTTIGKLPVRESQEETDPEEPNPGGSPNSAKSGSSLKASGGGSIGEVYTVINNNTGEIVDSLELHKLTNVIWYDYFGKYYPFHLNSVEDFNLNKDGIYYNNDYISSWVCMPCIQNFTYLTVFLYYNYTLRPGNSVRIQTTNSYTITDIDEFFD